MFAHSPVPSPHGKAEFHQFSVCCESWNLSMWVSKNEFFFFFFCEDSEGHQSNFLIISWRNITDSLVSHLYGIKHPGSILHRGWIPVSDCQCVCSARVLFPQVPLNHAWLPLIGPSWLLSQRVYCVLLSLRQTWQKVKQHTVPWHRSIHLVCHQWIITQAHHWEWFRCFATLKQILMNIINLKVNPIIWKWVLFKKKEKRICCYWS